MGLGAWGRINQSNVVICSAFEALHRDLILFVPSPLIIRQSMFITSSVIKLKVFQTCAATEANCCVHTHVCFLPTASLIR